MKIEQTRTIRQGQQGHSPKPKISQRQTQCDAILARLNAEPGSWVPCYELAGLALQYNSRLFTLRNAGFLIQNKRTRVNGVVHSWYRILPSPTHEATTPDESQGYSERMEAQLRSKALPLFARVTR